MGINIAVDNDDILINLHKQLILFHNEVYGTNLKKEDLFSYYFHEVWGCTRDEAVRKVYEFFESEYFKNVQPIDGAYESMKYLKARGHDLFVVTGRTPRLVQKTIDDLDKYFPNIFSGVCFANTYDTTGIKISKSVLCRKVNSKIIIDDDLLHIHECANSGITVVVPDYPWNQGILPQKATRVYSWKQVTNCINIFANNFNKY